MKMIAMIFGLLLLITPICRATLVEVVAGPELSSEPILALDELFSPDHQKEHIHNGEISFGEFKYNVFADYTVKERKEIYQICKKYLPDDWETLMYMNQFVVKPFPFPYKEYPPIPEPSTLGVLGFGSLVFFIRR